MDKKGDLVSLSAIAESNRILAKLAEIDLSKVPEDEAMYYFLDHPENLDKALAKLEEYNVNSEMMLIPFPSH